MTPEEIWKRHKELYHITHREALPMIREVGLLSAEALVDLFAVSDPRRQQLLHERRASIEELVHPKLGSALLSDNAPLSEAALEKCLQDGLTTRQWLGLLNGKVFFWTKRKFATQFAGSKHTNNGEKVLLVFDARPLVECYFDTLSICPINSGATRSLPQLGGVAPSRGLSTFAKADSISFGDWRWARGNKKPDTIKEITIDYSAPSVLDFLLDEVAY